MNLFSDLRRRGWGVREVLAKARQKRKETNHLPTHLHIHLLKYLKAHTLKPTMCITQVPENVTSDDVGLKHSEPLQQDTLKNSNSHNVAPP